MLIIAGSSRQDGIDTASPSADGAVFVTLADRNYLNAAKQLFASLHLHSGWRGDRLLLAHEVSDEEARWFSDRGILVRRCAPLFDGTPGGMPAVLTSKLYLFTPEFRRWRTVVYCDADATVRASLDGLLELRGFWSIQDASRFLDVQIAAPAVSRARGVPRAVARALRRELRREHDLLAPPFCAGFFVFSPELLDADVFDRLSAAIRRWHPVSAYGDQLAFNLVFRDSWQALPPVYNVQVHADTNQWRLPADEVDGIVLHYISRVKPWMEENVYSAEWRRNLARADEVGSAERPEGICWSDERIAEYCAFLSSRDRPPPLVVRWLAGRLGPRSRRLVWKALGWGARGVLAVRRPIWRLRAALTEPAS